MMPFSGTLLVEFVRDLTASESACVHAKVGTSIVSADDVLGLEPFVALCRDTADFFYLPATRARMMRLAAVVDEGNCTYAELAGQLRVLREVLEDELRERSVFLMPAAEVIHYIANETLLGTDVAARFPDLSSDIDEAGKCFATDRYTAVVFHLMRVMEVGVQELGNALGITLTEEKAWQNILDEVNKAVKALPKRDPKAPEYALLAANLFNVKLAWRNEVMHPKATYTKEEAERILSATKAFMNELVSVI
ncbi:MAG TPA: hypothetical protein VGO40_07480 [Longimicrobium sp.]|jgi:hypothetical protein|nr:hypothetical protein [Longimicrobium sp.]